ncbi:MAG: 2-C-methyl-D-erythritol 4-phosphate cytidylyltransferase [Candidatus Micrarchaeota archaeon]
MRVCAIIAASGKGTRMGGVNKQLLELKGVPVALRSIQEFHKNELVTDIIVVTQPESIDTFKEITKGLQKVRKVVAGGKERQDSVYNGLKVCGECDVVAVHNGANPLVSQDEITNCINAAAEHGAAVIAVKAKDTIKRVDDEGFVLETLNRKELWAMQTPQCLQYDVARKAFDKAMKEKFYGTDDVQLAERIGTRVKIVEGSYENFKITTPEDVLLAEKVLEKRAQG